MEKPLAQQAGIGWQGKHTNLVSREFGSWLFLGEIYLSLELEPDQPISDHCGSCRRCLDACPTAAFPAPHRLDARRCISYLTIEHKGMIPVELRPLIGNRIYGCDDCLAVCPWNKFAHAAHEPDFLPRAALTAPRLAELAALDDADFRQYVFGLADQAHRPESVFAQRADRDRQCRPGPSRSRRRRAALSRRSVAAGARQCGLGALAAFAIAVSGGTRAPSRGRSPTRSYQPNGIGKCRRPSISRWLRSLAFARHTAPRLRASG